MIIPVTPLWGEQVGIGRDGELVGDEDSFVAYGNTGCVPGY